MMSGQKINLFDRLCRIGFLILVALLPVVRPLSLYIGSLRVSVGDLFFPVVVLLWAASKVQGKAKARIGAFQTAVMVYGGALVISAVFTSDPYRSLLKLFGELYLFGLAFVAFDLARDRNFVRHVAYAWLAGTVLTIAGSVMGFAVFYLGYNTQADNYFLSHAGSLPAGNYPRIHSFFANANMMCNFLNVSLVLSLLAGELGWMRKRLSHVLTAGIWFAAVFTFSAGIGGMILSTGIWLAAKYKNAKPRFKSRGFLVLGILGAIGVFAAACFSPDTPNTDQQIHVPGIETTIEPSVRVLVWQSSLSTFAAHPIVGSGIGIDPARVFYTTLSGDSQILTDAHNMYLSVLAQSGVIGFAAFAWLIFLLVRQFKFDLSDQCRTIATALSCGIMGAFLYQGLTGSFEDARHLWILIGLFAGVSAQPPVPEAPASSSLV
jgi:O-antigen ligase